jgi:transcriptional regulator with XRE-family HTH domain
MRDGESLPDKLDVRRRELGLSHELLSRRSGVSRPTIQRILSGHHTTASFANVVAIAESLGLEIHLGSAVEVSDLKREQARLKARRLVGLVQGTSGLEGQAVDRGSLESMIERTTNELLAGSKQRLWSE